ncbi:hypothetical protein V6N13_083996 [Hibiscus sabdariffa]
METYQKKCVKTLSRAVAATLKGSSSKSSRTSTIGTSRLPYREIRATASKIHRRTKRLRNQERSETRARGEDHPNRISNNNLET